MAMRSVQRGRRTSRAFTLLELMVVVILIGLLALMAIPTMSQARMDRHVYEDAARIADLVRDARTRAMGRGAAVMVRYSSANGGVVQSFESVSPNPVTGGTPGAPRVPVGSCGSPSNWADANSMNLVRTVALGDPDHPTYEQTNGIKAAAYRGGAATANLSICFTPMGRAFIENSATPVFSTPMMQAAFVDVSRSDGTTTYGLVRRVLIPPSGNARVTVAQ